MKFVHAADLHLDSPLRGLEAYEGAPVDEIRGATRRALEGLVDLCLEEAADLLLLAGDLYDGDWRDYNTGIFFLRQMNRLTQEGVRVVWIRGNHDAASQITRRLSPPDGAFELATRRPETRVFEDLGVAVHGQSYAHREVTEDLAATYPEPVAGLFNIGLLHTALEGRAGHAPYAPSSVARLTSKGYDYWALGHVHTREIVGREPWIVFPGNLQGRHVRETGAKGASVVTVEDGVAHEPEHRVLDVVRWDVCEVDLSEVETGEEAVAAAIAGVRSRVEAADERLLALRVRFVGDSQADAVLRRDRERWRQQLRLEVEGLGASVWLEKISFDTRPRGGAAFDLEGDHPIAALTRSLARSLDAESLDEAIASALADLTNKLPVELRSLPDAPDFDDPDRRAERLERAARDLRAKLLALGDGA